MSVEGSAALAEYLGIIIPVKRVLQTVFTSRIYQYFVAAAPGLKELMTIGKIWYEAERTRRRAARLWDLVIVDAPATGHSLQYLRMPQAAREAFGAGLVRRESQRLVDLLTDPRRTAVNLVTTAEEMPVNETLEMYRQLRDELDMPTGLAVREPRARRRLQRAETWSALARGGDSARPQRARASLGEAVSRGARGGRLERRINARYLRAAGGRTIEHAGGASCRSSSPRSSAAARCSEHRDAPSAPT